MKQEEELLLTGNQAAAYGAMLSRARVVPIYPITPQTPVLETIVGLAVAGKMDAELMDVESEHSAMASSISASLVGARVFSATSSQGLLLMHEMLHYATGARAPIVLINVNRTVASPWGFWPDHLDSLAQRDTGWIQLYCENNQEVLDLVPIAYYIAEKAYLPVMVIYESFFISHSLEPVKVPLPGSVDSFLPPYNPPFRLDVNNPRAFGNVVSQVTWMRNRQNIAEAMEKVIGITGEAGSLWDDITGRSYDTVETYRCEGAELLLVTMGGPAGTCRESVDRLRDNHVAAGLVKVRMFRPFPLRTLRNLLSKTSRVVVLDRNYAPGMGGILHQEVKAALYGVDDPPWVYGYLTGVGGTDITPGLVEGIVYKALECREEAQSKWVG